MKKITTCMGLALFFGACSSPTESEDTTEATDEIASGVEYSYSNSFEMADPSYLEIVRNWNDGLASGDLDMAFSNVGDSLNVIMADGSEYNSTSDSLRNLAAAILESYSDITVYYLAGLSVKSVDADQTWVLSYTDETFTNEEGEERSIAHELYQIVDGKIRSIHAYSEVPSEVDTPPSEDQGNAYAYSNSWEMGNPDDVTTIENFITALDEENMEGIGEYFADSVTIFFADGSMMNGTRDNAVADITGYLENADLSMELIASFPAKSTDRNENWVLIWLNETESNPEGTSSYVLHEAYMMEGGKIRLMRQFMRTLAEE